MKAFEKICLAVVYLICYFSLWKGIGMSGKVVWFTALFPYVVLGVLFIRGITLPGSEMGIDYYLRPKIEMLKKPSVWQDAATQVFFSLGPGFGVLMAYSSYNNFNNNVYLDALITSAINCATSFLSGFVIFSVLGYMSCKSGKPIDSVAQEGPGLVFVVYPEALATMPWAPGWSVLFFLMLMTLGLDSSDLKVSGGSEASVHPTRQLCTSVQVTKCDHLKKIPPLVRDYVVLDLFGGSEAIITALSDEFPTIKRNREIFIACLFSFYMLVGFFICTNGGILIMEWLIVYGVTWSILIAVFCEAMVVAYIYGISQFVRDLKEMLGFEPGIYWRICWMFLAPVFLLMMILSSFIHYQPLTYQDYKFSPLANILGIFFALSAASAIPIVGLYKFYTAKGSTIREKFRRVVMPYRRRPSQHEYVPIGRRHSSDVML
ncbi:hypothetical protein RB195_008930 [Necator americanus]|uniref:Sodium:neurotransmitter symporter family protein n=1 Tax=Necator americanus TaxID=51031 RepID=A0ABR1CR11_NECAM